MVSMQTQVLIVLFFCHFLADYTHLSTAWMLGAKKLGTPLIPILTHAGVHAILMLITLCFMFAPEKGEEILYVALFQLVTHFLIDVWKGKMNYWFPSLQNPANIWHWIIFGIDQYFHALVIILISWYII